MKPVAIDLSAHQLRLLAINALFEQAWHGAPDAADSSQLMREMLLLGDRLLTAPCSVRIAELDDARASVLCHSLDS